MAFTQLYIVLLMVMATETQREGNTTTPAAERFLTNATEEKRDSATSLGARRAVCFQAAEVAVAEDNSSVPLHPSFPSSVAGITCNTSLLVHFTLTEFWANQSAPTMCQFREEYGEVTECVLEATKTCLPLENHVNFPDKDKVKTGLQYICDVAAADQFDVDVTCARALSQQVLDCINADVQEVIGGVYLPSAVQPDLVCRTYDIADLCCWETLQACGRDTAAAYTRMMSLYFRPPSCTSSASKLSADFAIALLMLSFIFKWHGH